MEGEATTGSRRRPLRWELRCLRISWVVYWWRTTSCTPSLPRRAALVPSRNLLSDRKSRSPFVEEGWATGATPRVLAGQAKVLGRLGVGGGSFLHHRHVGKPACEDPPLPPPRLDMEKRDVDVHCPETKLWGHAAPPPSPPPWCGRGRVGSSPPRPLVAHCPETKLWGHELGATPLVS